MPGTRLSTSAIPEYVDPEFVLAADATEFTTRHSIVSFEPTAKAVDGGNGNGNGGSLPDAAGGRESNFSDVSGIDYLHFWNVEDDESSLTSTGITPRSMMRNDPYQGVTVEVNNHSIDNHGVVMYHVDIRGPNGLLSTYTIRRRYRAFRNLHIEMTRLISEYEKRLESTVPTSSSGVPFSPATQSTLLQRQSFARVVLPPLPSAGVWTYLKRHDVRLVEQRKKRFQEILRIAIRHPATRSSAAMDTFLSIAPSEISQRGSAYTSLQEYSVPVSFHQRESVERRQRKKKVLEDRRQRTNSEAEMR